MTALRPSTVWALLVGFCAVLGAVVALVLTGHDPQTLASVALTLAGILGLGAHQAATGKTIAKIDKQTNGVLTGRIKAAVREALNEENHVIPTTPVDVPTEDPEADTYTAPEAPETPDTTEAAPAPEPAPAVDPALVAAVVAALQLQTEAATPA